MTWQQLLPEKVVQEKERGRAPTMVVTIFYSLILEVSYHLDALGHTDQPGHSVGGDHTGCGYQGVGASWKLATTSSVTRIDRSSDVVTWGSLLPLCLIKVGARKDGRRGTETVSIDTILKVRCRRERRKG